jgi:hypothetical protein
MMRSIQTIENWTYPVILLALFIFCLINSKNRGIKYLTIGFGIMFFNSISWHLLEFLNLHSFNSNRTDYYQIIRHFSVVLFIAESVFLFIGISMIAKNFTVKYYSGTFEDYISSKYVNKNDFGNTGLYVFLLIAGVLLFAIGLFTILEDSLYSLSSSSIFMIFIGVVLLLSAHIYFVVILFRAWQFSINESYLLNLNPSIESAGKAVGYLFIPFFNFYWMFIAYGKLAKDLSAIADAKGVLITIPNEMGLALAILCVVSIIPVVGYVTSVIALIMLPIFISQVITQCSLIAEENQKSDMTV